jgi:hypothetical protein
MVLETYPCGVRTITASVVVEGPAVEVEQLWHDPSRWASWIDGFAHLSRLDDDWPQAGARRVWVTPPGGRGLISETATAYTAGSGHGLEFEDERVRGLQQVRLESDGVRTRITVTIDLATKAPLAPARKWWLRRQLGDSLRLSLRRFSYELAADRDR